LHDGLLVYTDGILRPRFSLFGLTCGVESGRALKNYEGIPLIKKEANMRANMLVRIVVALGLALALAACSSSSGPSQSDLDKARADAKMYMGQVTAASTALTAAGATGETLVEMIASLGGTDVDVDALMELLTDAGAEGDTLAEQINDLVADILKKKRDDAIATISTVYGLLTPTTLIPVEDPTTAPMDATKDNTQAEPDMKSWSEVYDVIDGKPTITMITAVGTARTQGAWANALIPGRGTTSNAAGDLSAEGTFMGIAGTFTCANNGQCGIAFVDDDKTGKIDTTGTLGDDWMFAPTDGLTTQVAIEDENYVSYGFWLTKDDDGNPTAFSVFYEGKGTYMTSRALPTVDEKMTAKYSGPARGKYVKRELDGMGSLGYFTANAMLTAVIQPAGDEEPTTVSGAISNFMDEDKDMMPFGALKVDLDKDIDGATDMVYSGTASSKVDALGLGAGSWEAQFYGGEQAAAPAEAGGAFSYGWALGAVQGAFGAELEKDAE
jgi:hypothetical protein